MMIRPGAAVGGQSTGVGRGRGRDSVPARVQPERPRTRLCSRNLSEVCFICAKPSLGTGKSG
jgi:hypothetical protein